MPDRKPSASPPPPSPGLAARRVVVDIVSGVLQQKRPLDDLLERCDIGTLPERDRALVRTIVATVLRRLGTLRHMLGGRLERGLPKSAPNVEDILLIGAAQILFLDVPDHASVDLSVRLAQADTHASHYSGLVNGVLRKLARDGKTELAALDTTRLDTPEWLMERWTAHYGWATARAIAVAHAQEPALDLTVKSDPAEMGGGARRPRARHRNGASGDIRSGAAAARLRRRRVVGAGRCRRLAREAARRHPRQVRRRSLRRTWRQNRATGAGRRASHRRRSLGAAP